MSIYESRTRKLRDLAIQKGLAGIAVVPGPNLAYLLGVNFSLSERPTVAIFSSSIGAEIEEVTLILPELEKESVTQNPLPMKLFTYNDTQGPASAFSQALSHTGLAGRVLGVESRRIRFLELECMARSGHAPHPTACDDVFAQLRMCKTSDELGLMRQAIEIAQIAFAKTLPLIRAGISEREIASELVLQTLKAGGDVKLPFQPIVATGDHGAHPHAVPSDRKLAAGELVTIDWGAFYKGYAADLTRTLAVAGGEVPTELRRAYEVVKAANDAGRAKAKPGIACQDVDRASRQVIVDAGMGEYFTHRTGHGLGLEVHEEPDMKEGSLTILREGMTFTVEPGVYIPNLGGIRIEDDLVITHNGSETLTNLPRELIL